MMSRIIIGLFSISLLLWGSPQDFNESKRELVKLYKNLGGVKEFYCNAPIKISKNKISLIPSNAFSPRVSKSGKISKRASVIEWEHIMPMSNAYHHFSCWRNGGRKNCQKVDQNFNKLEADMFNLVPSIGSINGDRSNYHYAESPRDLNFNQYGNCKVFTDFKGKRFYPADYSKGYIARTYLYMSKQYKIKLSSKERKLMEAWNKKYPMSQQEKKIREETSKIMGVDFFKVLMEAK